MLRCSVTTLLMASVTMMASAALAQSNGTRYTGTWTTGSRGNQRATCVVSIRGKANYLRTLRCKTSGMTGGFNLSSCHFSNRGKRVSCSIGDRRRGTLETFQGVKIEPRQSAQRPRRRQPPSPQRSNVPATWADRAISECKYYRKRFNPGDRPYCQMLAGGDNNAYHCCCKACMQMYYDANKSPNPDHRRNNRLLKNCQVGCTSKYMRR